MRNVVAFVVANESVRRGSVRDENEPEQAPDETDYADHVENRRPATVEAVLAEETAQRKCNHLKFNLA